MTALSVNASLEPIGFVGFSPHRGKMLCCSNLSAYSQLSWLRCALCQLGRIFFELTNKMSLSPVAYMTVQKIYAGWAFFGIPIITALLLTSIHTFTMRNDRAAFLMSVTAVLCLAATQVIFWIFTYPINVATNNWTIAPEAFEAARRQWEYSHAVNAVLTFVAFVAIVLSVLSHKGQG